MNEFVSHMLEVVHSHMSLNAQVSSGFIWPFFFYSVGDKNPMAFGNVTCLKGGKGCIKLLLLLLINLSPKTFIP